MTKGIIYDTITGEIQGSSSGNLEDVLLSKLDHQSVLISNEDHKDKRVIDGVLVPIPEEELEAQKLEKAWQSLRSGRALLLRNSDWTQVPDAPVDAAAWAVYRQQLRDLPANTTDPRTVEWPVPPS